MAIQIGNYNFEGPFFSTTELQRNSGTYVVLGNSGGDIWNVVDVGESSSVRDRIENHDRKDNWARQRHSRLSVAALYLNESQRLYVERILRAQFNPPCGQR